MTAKELIEAYNIFDAGNGQIGIKNVTRIKKDNMIDEVKARKKEILEVFEAEKRAEKERSDKIAAIEGLNEINAEKEKLTNWNKKFRESFEGEYAVGGLGVGKKPEYDFEAAYKKYPRAAAYLRAEEEELKTNYELSHIGSKAKERIINGDDPESVMQDMDKDIHEFTNRHLWD